jgi:hypothetical protein
MKIKLELDDSDAEQGMDLLRRAVETVDRLDTIAEDLEELREMITELRELHNANKVQRRRPPVSNKR